MGAGDKLEPPAILLLTSRSVFARKSREGGNKPIVMNHQQLQFLSVRTLPARLGIDQAAWYLGFAAHEVTILMSVGLLKPLGRPAATGSKYFATVELQQHREDPRWLAKASDAVVFYWRSKNGGRRRKQSYGAGGTISESNASMVATITE